MSILFETTQVRNMQLPNRFFRSATWEGMAAENGDCTDNLISTMVKLAKGGVGLIVTGHAYVNPAGQATPWQLGVYHDRQVAGLQSMTKAVHDHGGKIAIQLAHAGLFADPKLTGLPPRGPSVVDGFGVSNPQSMSTEHIEQVISDFGTAAVRAEAAGFDGIQVHAAHGYLLSQFISPVFNLRKDDYGGPIVNRVRLPAEIGRQIRRRIDKQIPLFVKMNNQDFIPGGLTLAEAIDAGQVLADSGFDAIEISGGTGASGKLGPIRNNIRSESEEAYFQEAGAAFKKALLIPIVLVGGIRSLQTAEKLVNHSIADYIAMSRPFIREPDLVRRWQSGDLRPSTCLSDSKCFIPARKGQGLYCVMHKRLDKNPTNP